MSSDYQSGNQTSFDQKVRILCVDDEPYILTTLQRFFRKDKYEIHTAISAETGLALLEEIGPVRIVLSDYRMTGLNGVEFLRKVHHLWPQTVGILLSGYAEESVVTSAMNEDFIYRHLPKPWSRAELRSVIDDALAVVHDGPISGADLTFDENQQPEG